MTDAVPPQVAALRDRHFAYYRDVASRLAASAGQTSFAVRTELYEIERANFESALEWAVTRGWADDAVQIVLDLILLRAIHDAEPGGARLTVLLERLIAAPETSARARGKAFLARARLSAADNEARRVLALDAAAILEGCGEEALTGAALSEAGWANWFDGRLTEATALHSRAVDLLRPHGESSNLVEALRGLGWCAMSADDHDRSIRLHDEAAEALERMSVPVWQATHYDIVGNLHWNAGRLPAARAAKERAVDLLRDIDKIGLVESLDQLGDLLVEFLDDWPTAETLFTEMLSVSRELGHAAAEATALRGLAQLSLFARDIDVADDLASAGIERFLSLEERPPWQGGMRCGLLAVRAAVAVLRSDRAAAEGFLREGIAQTLSEKSWRGRYQALDLMRGVADALGPRAWRAFIDVRSEGAGPFDHPLLMVRVAHDRIERLRSEGDLDAALELATETFGPPRVLETGVRLGELAALTYASLLIDAGREPEALDVCEGAILTVGARTQSRAYMTELATFLATRVGDQARSEAMTREIGHTWRWLIAPVRLCRLADSIALTFARAGDGTAASRALGAADAGRDFYSEPRDGATDADLRAAVDRDAPSYEAGAAAGLTTTFAALLEQN